MNLFRFETITRKAHLYTDEQIFIEPSEHPFETRSIHIKISIISKKLFDDGHYAQATFESCKYIEKLIKHLSSVNKTGFQLMMDAFNENTPKIQLNNLISVSEKDEQIGYKFLFTGSSLAIRNPRGHEINFTDSIDDCLDHLTFLSMLVKRIEKSGFSLI